MQTEGNTYHNGSVVDQDVDPAPSLDNLFNDSVTSLLIPDILGKEETLPASSDDELLGLLGIDLLLG
jgi:hypothetical protein